MKPSFFKNLGPHDLLTIKSKIIGTTDNNKNIEFTALVGLTSLENNTISFLYDNQELKNYEIDNANNYAIICSEQSSKKIKKNIQKIIVKDVHLAVSILSNLFYRDYSQEEINTFPKPVIGKNSIIQDKVTIENGSIIGSNVKICDGAVIKSGCMIGNNSFIDCNSVISNSIIGEDVKIGRNCSIGQPGFGFSIQKSNNENIYHMGRVIIQSRVRIGSNCTLDRGSFGDTVIGENTYLDNLCHIAHNVSIGNNCVFTGMNGIAGSTTVGNGVLSGGQVGIAGHLKIGNNVQIAAKSGVINDIDDNTSVMGNPAVNKFRYIKQFKKTYG